MQTTWDVTKPRAALAKFPFSLGNLVACLLLYLIAGVILFTQVGLWEAIRHTVINGAIVLAWLGVSALILKDEPLPETISIRRPFLELAWGLVTFLVVVLLAAIAYPDWSNRLRGLYLAVFYGSLILLYVGLRYPPQAIGLILPSRRGWFTLAAVILVNLLSAAVFWLLPFGEAEPIPGADLANQVTGPAVSRC